MSKQIFPAEFVLPGHPDKLCDAIADSLVQEAVHRDHLYVTGRIACEGAETIDVEAIVRDVYRSAGYGEDWLPVPEQVTVVSNLCLGPLADGEAEFRELSDDQAICIGYANNLAATNHLPVEQWLAARLARRSCRMRRRSPRILRGWPGWCGNCPVAELAWGPCRDCPPTG